MKTIRVHCTYNGEPMQVKIPYYLIERYFSDKASACEQQLLFDWVSAAPEHEQVFNDLVQLWKTKEKTNTPPYHSEQPSVKAMKVCLE